jgi:lysophospholipase
LVDYQCNHESAFSRRPLPAIAARFTESRGIHQARHMELYSTEGNPAPANARTGMLPTPDGAQLRYAYWRTARPPCKGTVLLLQGRSEFIEKYFETITGLREAGFDVCTFDFRGQGGSSRLIPNSAIGYIENFDQYVTDVETVFKGVALPDCRPPYYIFAHSMGGTVALFAAPRLVNSIERMVLSCPLVRFGEMPAPRWLLAFMAGFLVTFGLGAAKIGGQGSNERRRFAGNRLTSDLRRFERNIALAASYPQVAIGGPSAAWLYAAGDAVRRLDDPDFIGSIQIPTLLVGGGADTVVSLRAIEELGFRMRSGKTVVITGAQHEILQERDVFREQLLAAFHAFIPGSKAP